MSNPDRDGILQDAIDLFIVATLRADAALTAIVEQRIYPDIAPAVDAATGAAPAMPYVVYSQITGRHTLGGWGEVLDAKGIRFVKAVARGGYDATRAARRRLYAALHKAEGEIVLADADGARVRVTCHVDERRHYLETTAGAPFAHDGWTFRFTASLVEE